MASVNTSIVIPEDLHKRLGIASAACGLTSSELIRVAIRTTLQTMIDHDPRLGAAFDYIESREAATLEAIA